MADVVTIVFVLYLMGKVEYKKVCSQAYTINRNGYREVEFCGKKFSIKYHTDNNVKEVNIKTIGDNVDAWLYPTEMNVYDDVPCDGFTISTDMENEMLKVTVYNNYDN